MQAVLEEKLDRIVAACAVRNRYIAAKIDRTRKILYAAA